MKRLAAILASVAIISLSIWFTTSRDGDDNEAGGGRDGSSFVVACAADLGTLCGDLAESVDGVTLSIADPAETIESLLAGDGPDAWLTATPWPGLLETRATVAGTPRTSIGADDALAQRSVDLIISELWRSAVVNRCGDPVDWACLVDAVGRPAAELGAPGGGAFKLGIAQPSGIDGVASLGALLQGWFTSPAVDQPDYDGFDLEDRFTTPLSTLRRNGGTDRDPFNMLVTRPGTYGATLTLGGAQRLAGLSRDDLTLSALALRSTATARLVVVADTAEARDEALRVLGRDDLVRLAVQHGWTETDDSPDGLPNPALLDLVITKWMDR